MKTTQYKLHSDAGRRFWMTIFILTFSLALMDFVTLSNNKTGPFNLSPEWQTFLPVTVSCAPDLVNMSIVLQRNNHPRQHSLKKPSFTATIHNCLTCKLICNLIALKFKCRQTEQTANCFCPTNYFVYAQTNHVTCVLLIFYYLKWVYFIFRDLFDVQRIYSTRNIIYEVLKVTLSHITSEGMFGCQRFKQMSWETSLFLKCWSRSLADTCRWMDALNLRNVNKSVCF